jgi:transposase
MRSWPLAQGGKMNQDYGRIAGIDVHKKWLYVVVEGERRRTGTTPLELRALRTSLSQKAVDSVVMESTAQYWRPVWAALAGSFRLFLAQAQSNRARSGRKTDFGDAERLIRRLAAGELVLSFVPEPKQQEWRMLTRTRVEYTREINHIRNQMEMLLETAGIKISGYLSDLLGVSGRRMLDALAAGETDAQALAALADARVRASNEELEAALEGTLSLTQRLVLKQQLNRVRLLEQFIEELSSLLQESLQKHREAITRLCAVPGIAVCAAEQMVAELGPEAAAFASERRVASWVGVCPGREESAGKSRSNATPPGNRSMRRILAQSAWAAVRTKNSFFQLLFKRLVPRLGTQKAIWAVAHRLLRIVWIVLHRKVDYREMGPLAFQPASQQRRVRNMIRELASCGYQVTGPDPA